MKVRHFFDIFYERGEGAVTNKLSPVHVFSPNWSIYIFVPLSVTIIIISAPRGEGPEEFIGGLVLVPVPVTVSHPSRVRLPSCRCGGAGWRCVVIRHRYCFRTVVATVLMADASRRSIGVVQCSIQPRRGYADIKGN